MFYAWGEFYKHSAYFLNKSELNKEALTNSQIKPFEYHPFYSMEYFVKTEEPDWGVDFDEGQGGIGIYSKNLNINFGKNKLSYGPFHRGNLSLSLKNPSFPPVFLALESAECSFASFSKLDPFSKANLINSTLD